MVNALKKGQETVNPEKGKKQQLLANIAALVAGGLVAAIKTKYPDLALMGLENYLSEIILGVIVAINAYFIPATSKKIGLGS